MMRLATCTWTDVEEYLKNNKSLLFPVGSTEQHGPTGCLGTDFITADGIALEVGKREQVLVAPPLCYGMASHHMAFPGSVTIRPSVYQQVISEILRSYYSHGFREFFIINGHGGNEYSIRSVFQELKHEGLEEASFHLFNWWRLPEVASLAQECFKDREGFHATPSEVSVTMYLENLKTRPYRSFPPIESRGSWPLTAREVRAQFPDGVMMADPGLATVDLGKRFFEVAVNSLCKSVTEIQRAKYGQTNHRRT